MLPLIVLVGLLALGAHAAQRPHILLVILDDIGRTDTGVYGESNVPMPNLVNLGKQGTVLENLYTQTVCSPTRSSLMTGRFPFRFGMQHPTSKGQGCQATIISTNLAIFADKPVMEKLIDGLDFWANDRPLFAAVGITRWICSTKQEAHPLFVYLAHQTVHIPLEPKRDQERCGKITHKVRRVYCSMLVELDDSLGQLVKQYKAHKLWENTLVILLTDNGGMVNFNSKPDGYPVFPASQGSNYPLRGSKITLFDGGVRSLGLISGGYLPSSQYGKRYKGLAHVVDLSATILGAAGLFPLKRESLKLDGQDLLPLILGTGGSPRTDVPINIINKGLSYSAIRFGKYKLIIKDNLMPAAQSWFDKQGDLLERSPDASKETLLFDLEQDEQERNDLAVALPEVVQQGLDLIQSYATGGESGMDPAAFPFLHGGTWAPYQSERTWKRHFAKQQQQRDEEDVKTS
ncbi:hypothetical protein BASA81_004127 [Batrachochytrium salamandrivorans]|nr:hypothetical protein BASA81_004127 [Batrachochytrium salamandrivorans]